MLTAEMMELIRNAIRDQVAAVPYTMTPDEKTDQERNGGTLTNEERAAQPGSQFEVCEDRLDKLGYSHVEKAEACAGLSIHAPTPEQQADFMKAKQAEYIAAEEAQRRKGEALRDKIAANRSKH